jgi:TolB-like protein/tetratricopeptide (TPR) repeat protein
VTLSAGTRLGPYEIVAPLGAGGMGEVYRARDERLGREVAIKVLPARLASDPDALARFEREARAVAALSHPNILAIHDFGTQDGVAYAVAELLDGQTLRDKLEDGPILRRQALDFAVQMAKGLSAAHERGVVHRDLKPENVFVSKDGHIKILDFGLAKRQEPVEPGKETSAPTASGHTEPGTVMGTVGYMSPEQVRGLALDARSDLFSFGAVLYEMLSGRKAFKRQTAADTMSAILKEEPTELTGSAGDVSIALDHVVRHCLEKEREQRFQSARDIVFALTEASGAVAVGPARPATSLRALLIAAAVAILAMVVVWLGRRPPLPTLAAPGPRRVAVLPFENLGAPEDDYFADGMADEIRSKLTSVRGIEVIARNSSTPYKKTAKAPRQIAQELGARYLLTATVRWQKSGGTSRVHLTPELVEITDSGAPSSRWGQPFDAALTDVFQVQSDIASRVAESLGAALAGAAEAQLHETPTANLAAYDAFLKGEEAWHAPRDVRKALGLWEQAVALDPGFAQAWARISEANSDLFDGNPRPELADGARQAAEKAEALAPGLPEVYLALGAYQEYVTHDLNRALEHYAQGRRLAPANVDLLYRTGIAEGELGRLEPSLDRYRQAERLDPHSYRYSLLLGQALLWLGRYPEAREDLDRGLVMKPGNHGLIGFKAMTFLAQGDLSGARAVIGATPAEVESVASIASFWDIGWVLSAKQRDLLLLSTPTAFGDSRIEWANALAQACAVKGDRAGVLTYAEEARKAIEEDLHATPKSGYDHSLIGLALAYLGQAEEAVHEGKLGVDLRPIAQDAYTGPYSHHQLARIYMLVGEPEKALDELESLLKIPYFLSPGWLKVDPNFDSLRGNPRFQKLVAGK